MGRHRTASSATRVVRVLGPPRRRLGLDSASGVAIGGSAKGTRRRPPFCASGGVTLRSVRCGCSNRSPSLRRSSPPCRAPQPTPHAQQLSGLLTDHVRAHKAPQQHVEARGGRSGCDGGRDIGDWRGIRSTPGVQLVQSVGISRICWPAEFQKRPLPTGETDLRGSLLRTRRGAEYASWSVYLK